jgi:ribonuclease HI
METDGACAGNQEKKGLGGWGAVLRQEHHNCTLFGPQPDTSNNEMEHMAMWKAMQMIPHDTYVVFECD